MSIMKLLAEKTGGESFRSRKYDLDRYNLEHVRERASSERVEIQAGFVRECGETEARARHIDLTSMSRQWLASGAQRLTFFLDGSRRVFKVDDIDYGSGGRKNFYPVIAGQVGIGCCRRLGRRIVPERFERNFLLVLPSKANADWINGFWSARTKELNELESLRRLNIKFEEILHYRKSESEESFEDQAIAQVMSFMNAREQAMVARLVREGKLDQKNYLVKDGSLEYLPLEKTDRKTAARLKNNYLRVIGVSKSFNPNNCLDAHQRLDQSVVADLPLHHRTVARRLEFKNMQFAVWYVRLRDKRQTRTPFDGVIKVEKMLVDEAPADSDELDMLSALLINERNPVCYGSDPRWANHIYPIYLTEAFVKSKYIGTESFLQLF